MKYMKYLSLAVLMLSGSAFGQAALPWGTALSIPYLASQSGVALFYVANYTLKAGHTDYDLARADADAYLVAHPTTPTYVILNPYESQTCDDVPLPVVPTGTGTAATVSIIGYGSGLSLLQKKVGCGSAATTLALNDIAGAGLVHNAWFQGFTADANHIDTTACSFSGMSGGTFFDIACGNALPNADHEIQFGNPNATVAGVDTLLTLYNIKAFDNVGSGKGALLTPLWSGTSLAGATVVSGGSKEYTGQYARATIIGSGLSSCSSVPTLTPTVAHTSSSAFANLPTTTYGYVTGVTVTNPGHCTDTADLYILIQDGVPVVSGMKFSNMTLSHAWNLETTASAQYGEWWISPSGNNTIIGEHIWTNQTIDIAEFAAADKHINAYFDGPGQFGAAISGHPGSFVNTIFSWDSTTYLGSAGYTFLGAASATAGWSIQNSQCTNSIAHFVPITTPSGPLAATAAPPSGVTLNDIETCDGSLVVDWPTSVSAN
jgi:hypothetical protein